MINKIKTLKHKLSYFILATLLLTNAQSLYTVCSSDVDLDNHVIINVSKIVFSDGSELPSKTLNEQIYDALVDCAGREPNANEINTVANDLWLYRSDYIRLCTDATNGVISTWSTGKTYTTMQAGWDGINICGDACKADAWGLPTTSTGSNSFSESWVYWDHATSTSAGWCRISNDSSFNCNIQGTGLDRFGLPALLGIVVDE